MGDILRITTAQNVEIQYETASVGARIGAYFIDGFIKVAYFLIFIFIISEWPHRGSQVYISIPFLIPFVFYSFLFEKFQEGQTPGKQALNIKVVSMNGDPVTTGMYLQRWLFRIVDFQILPPIIAIVVIVMGEKGQRLGDIVANTTVIKIRPDVLLEQTAYTPVEENYEVSYPSVLELESNDIATIKEVLNNKSALRFQLIKETALKIEGVLGVTRKESSEAFLKSVVKDYNFLILQELNKDI